MCESPTKPLPHPLYHQVIVQRSLASKNMVHAKGGVVLAAALKFLPLFIMVFPGMAARVLYTDTIACSDPAACKSFCGSESGCSNLAYIELVLKLLPTGRYTVDIDARARLSDCAGNCKLHQLSIRMLQ